MKINNENNYSNVQKDMRQTEAGEAVSKGSDRLPQKGEVIKGEITDVWNKEITIKLSNGETVKAKVIESFEFNIGARLSFLVKDSNANQLTLTPIVDEGKGAQEKLTSILNHAGITVNENNLTILEKLLLNNLPVDNENLNKMINFSKQYSDMSADSLIFMAKNDITINRENIDQLQLMTSGENKLMENLSTLCDELSSLIDKEIGSQIVKIVLGNNQVALETMEQLNEQITKNDLSDKGESPSNSPNGLVLEPNQENEIQSIPKEGPLIGANTSTDSREAATLIDALNQTTTSDKTLAHNRLILSDILSETAIERLQTDMETILKDSLTSHEINSLMQEGSLEEIFNGVKALEMDDDSKTALTNLISKNISYGLIAKEVLMNPSQLEDPAKLNDYYNNLHDKIKEILSLNELGINKETTEVFNEATNVKNAVAFMDELGTQFTYVQLPLLFEDKLLNSELYVFNNKRQLNRKNQTMTALVRLDLVNLGHLDIYVKKTNQDIECNFYTESSEKSSLLQNQTSKLNNRLNNAGFNVKGLNVIQQKKEVNILDELMAHQEEGVKMKRYSFDMRA
jgi:flagellar hook-length control protein FliK